MVLHIGPRPKSSSAKEENYSFLISGIGFKPGKQATKGGLVPFFSQVKTLKLMLKVDIERGDHELVARRASRTDGPWDDIVPTSLAEKFATEFAKAEKEVIKIAKAISKSF